MSKHHIEITKIYTVENATQEELEEIAKKYIEEHKSDGRYRISANIKEIKDIDEDEDINGVYELCQRLIRYDAMITSGGLFDGSQLGIHKRAKEVLAELNDTFDRAIKGES